MFFIDKVEIDGFWGNKTINANFFTDVNCFIGKNGTGKTTFINILQAILSVDIRNIIELPFDSATIILKSKNNNRRKISVKFDDNIIGFNTVKYKIGNKTYEVPYFLKSFQYDNNRFTAKIEGIVNKIKSEMSELINLTTISVHRDQSEYGNSSEFRKRTNLTNQAPIDIRLEQLVNRLARYQLTISEEANKLLSNFQKQVLLSIIYDEDFDSFNWDSEINVELRKERDGLIAAYKDLDILDDDTSRKIDNHITVLSKGVRKLNSLKRNPSNSDIRITVDDIFPVPLIKRTQHIVSLSKKLQDDKKNIFSHIAKFINILTGFIEDKNFEFDSSGDLIAKINGREIKISELSSGEKQILVFLIETLLQENKPFIFIADEPELSLHIEWQAKLLSSINKINNNSQIIVATHSPEIVGSWAENIKQMEVIVDE